MKAAFFTLGCKVNQYETETIREQFRKAGFQIVPEEETADVYVVNTCTVTGLADRKSRQYIRKAHKLNPEAVIAVTGCYAQMDRDAVASIDGVSVVTGTNEKSLVFDKVMERLSDGGGQSDTEQEDDLNRYEELGVITEMEGRTRAFIKIQEGCDRFCSYCIIPYARGRVRSRDKDEITEEVDGLVSRGYREIVLTGINTALYGKDLGYDGIEPLISSICDIPGDFRIRLSSLEPTVIDADYAVRLLKYSKLCHHLHLSAQSGSDDILKAMNRHYTREDYLEIVRRLRDEDSFYGISADIIVGFPGETDEDFDESVRLAEESELVRTHVFKYSPRKGTRAAGMTCQVKPDVKKIRSEKLISAAAETGKRFMEKCSGQVRRVLFERVEESMLTGYTDNYIKVYVPAEGAGAAAGEFANVMLLDIYSDGMTGQIIREI